MTRISLALIVSLSLANAAWAQSSSEGTIRGTVKDEQGGVLPGVTVSASSPTVAGTITAVSGTDGSYRLLNLRPGEYTIVAELVGFSKYARSGIVVRSGLNLVVDIQIKVGTLAETIQVVGESPMLETQKPVQAVNISGELQRALPLSSRKDFSDFLELTPGITARTFDQGSGGQVYMLRGSEIENHVVQVDGADMGSFRQGWAGLYVGLSNESIDDTQITTGGVDASAPLGVGVVINIATPSGTNQIKGSAAAVYQAKGWNGNNAAAGGKSAHQKVFQPDLSLGGPLVKNKLFFFGSFRYADREVGISRTPDQLRGLAVDPAFTPFANGGKGKYYYVKGTAQLTQNHQMYVFYQRDFTPELAAFPTESKPFNIVGFGGNGLGARLSSTWGSAVTTKVVAAYNDKSSNSTFASFKGHTFPGPGEDIFTSSFISSGRRTGQGRIATTNTSSQGIGPTQKITLQADLTYFKTGWWGSHEFQTGVYSQPRLSIFNDTRYSNGGNPGFQSAVLLDPTNPTGGTVVFHRRVYDSPTIRSNSRLARDYAMFFQDAWKPSSRMTLTAGVRVDRILVKDRTFNKDVQDSWEIGPRFGGTFMLTKDTKNIVRANWGRVADVPQPGYLPSAGGNPVGQTDYYDNDLDGVFETVFRTPPVTPENSDQVVDPKRHMDFIDEAIVGYRRQLPRQVSVDISFVRRYYKDRPARVEINRIIDGVTFKGYKNEAQNDIFLVTNNEWNTQVYSGLEFTVAKRTKKLNVLGGYTRGWQHLDGTWIPGDPASYIQPAAFPNDTGIGTIRGNETNSLSGTADGRSPSWQKHAFRVGGAYNAPWKLLFASNLVFLSGPYSGPIVTRIAAPDPQFGPSTVTLSNGRVVSNPLATTIRFAYATRGEGQIKAPNLIIWNIRAGRNFTMAGRTLDVGVDVINVTNRRADQQFQNGGNQLYNTTNYAIAPDGSFRGQTRQAPRSAQLSVRYAF
ncbi:MAG: TonB-dependent receptor [Acidobacteria bacterium]|nr:TonB-dependent receptor [Acidobacteriota bacterium]